MEAPQLGQAFVADERVVVDTDEREVTGAGWALLGCICVLLGTSMEIAAGAGTLIPNAAQSCWAIARAWSACESA